MPSSGDAQSLYLDYAATSPTDARVIDAMLPYMRDSWYNPNSLYGPARETHAALEDARERVAKALGAAHPNEVIFTSGGTESDNAALLGIAARKAPTSGHVIVSAFEHEAILEPARLLVRAGHNVTRVAPNADGVVEPSAVAAAMTPDTFLVSVMHGNNEIGTLQPITEISEVVHAHGALFHTDAAQTVGKAPFDVHQLGVDAASFSGHKIYAPKGIGVLYLKRKTPFEPLISGGGQEFKKRSGTQNVAGAQAFARALEIMCEEMPTEVPRLTRLRDRIIAGVLSTIDNVQPSVASAPRLPNIASLLINGVEGEAMLLRLDAEGICVSTGSACSSGSLEPSHVLLAIGCAPEIAHGSLRVSVGRFTTDADVDYFLETLPPIVQRLREMSPLYQKRYGNSNLRDSVAE